MELGQFSVSLAVKDIELSKQFYKKLGFTVLDGTQQEGWLIMKNGGAVIGLFQGMFEHNILTFNPQDVHSIQQELDAKGVELTERTATDSGAAYITLSDPDGNAILIDQHPADYTPSPSE